jgi:hypothetical protein
VQSHVRKLNDPGVTVCLLDSLGEVGYVCIREHARDRLT